ncbi:protoporphyrinogen/coproporphyrinogen oxidase [Protaetiibacter larvae]|uniref:FAD-dependent oxidoreductase n=1 Tax=Protaetiibacter larvae TaxID=2592654 RepID=A0A5C1Y4X9_9MICO|nr:FAD-dependent oxidoreductase [Protaetiibacter larvae]QEO09093.1 FAD-dependent oxidoreductase [Protaetiibacter larvae]
MPDADVVVVGGGIAGLVVARELVLTGREVVLLESRDRLGGQVAMHSVAGIDLDAGAEAFATRGDDIPALLDILRLTGEVVTPAADPAWLYRADGTAVPLPATSLLGIPAVPLARDVVAAIGRRAAWRAQLDALLPSLVGAKAETVGELVRRRMGAGVVDGLVAPVVRGVHSSEPDELALDRAAPGLRSALLKEGTLAQAVHAQRAKAPAGSLVASLRGGLFRLVDALEAELERFGVEVRTGTPVVEADAGGVTTAAGERVDGEVVLAAPFAVDAPRTRVRVATIAVDAPELGAPRGTGVLVARGAPDVAARALTHLTAKWGWLAEATPLQLIRLSYDEGVEVTPERAHRDAERLLGAPLPAPVDAAIVDWERVGRRADPEHAIDGMHRVGEAESGTGLAAVIRFARSTGREIPSEGSADEG